jgi:hypothetical protein
VAGVCLLAIRTKLWRESDAYEARFDGPSGIGPNAAART